MRAAGFSGAKEQRFDYKDGVKCLQGQWSFSAYKKLKPQCSDSTTRRYFAFHQPPEPCVYASPHRVENFLCKAGKGKLCCALKIQHHLQCRAISDRKQFPLLTDTAIFSCRKARKKKNPKTFYCLRSLCLPRLLCCILLTDTFP